VRAAVGGADELEALRDRVAMLEAQLHEADQTRKMWEACMTSMVGAILLGPEMNDMCATPACGACSVGERRDAAQRRVVRFLAALRASIPARRA
jgi:hypothetical protein